MIIAYYHMLIWFFSSIIISQIDVLLVSGEVDDTSSETSKGTDLNVILILADAWRYSAFGTAEDPDALAMTPRLDGTKRTLLL